MPPSLSRRVTLPLVVAWSCLGTYLVAARVVGNSFPLSTFDMDQAHAPEVVARVVVIDAGGRKRELEHYEARSLMHRTHCPRGPDPCAASLDIGPGAE